MENVKAKKQKQAYTVKEKEENDQRDRENKEKIKQDLTREPKDLDPLENLLIKRQDIYCSHFKLKSKRTQVENMIRNDVMSKYPIYQEELEIIFSNDSYCAAFWSRNKENNKTVARVPGRQEE